MSWQEHMSTTNRGDAIERATDVKHRYPERKVWIANLKRQGRYSVRSERK